MCALGLQSRQEAGKLDDIAITLFRPNHERPSGQVLASPFRDFRDFWMRQYSARRPGLEILPTVRQITQQKAHHRAVQFGGRIVGGHSKRPVESPPGVFRLSIGGLGRAQIHQKFRAFRRERQSFACDLDGFRGSVRLLQGRT